MVQGTVAMQVLQVQQQRSLDSRMQTHGLQKLCGHREEGQG